MNGGIKRNLLGLRTDDGDMPQLEDMTVYFATLGELSDAEQDYFCQRVAEEEASLLDTLGELAFTFRQTRLVEAVRRCRARQRRAAN
jgi:hypothetical protein